MFFFFFFVENRNHHARPHIFSLLFQTVFMQMISIKSILLKVFVNTKGAFTCYPLCMYVDVVRGNDNTFTRHSRFSILPWKQAKQYNPFRLCNILSLRCYFAKVFFGFVLEFSQANEGYLYEASVLTVVCFFFFFFLFDCLS